MEDNLSTQIESKSVELVEKYSILVKNNHIEDSPLLFAVSEAGILEKAQQKLKDLKEKNTGKYTYFLSDSEVAKTLVKSSIIYNKTEENIEEVPEVVILTEQEKIAPFLPNIEYLSENFSIIGKKISEDLSDLQINDLYAGNLTLAKKSINLLNKQNDSGWEYFIITNKFSSELKNMPDNLVEKIINKTQDIIGLTNLVTISSVKNKKIEPAIEPSVDATSQLRNELLPLPGLIRPKIELSTKEKTKENVPLPSEIKSGYQPVAEQFKFFKNNAFEFNKKSGQLNKNLMLATIGLIGVGTFSMTIAPIAIPTAFAIGAIAIVKAKYFKSPTKEGLEWTKRGDLLKTAILNSSGYNRKQQLRIDQHIIEQVAFTPEILEQYQQLCKKSKIQPQLITTVNQLRDKFSDTTSKRYGPK